ncbi:MAG: Cytochrome c oxidase polypeptide II [uncultured Acidimicrobiales bacterium]|uniref:cytochrome-c oxidase n=1 Tax=uncultured Acidimicrobiales bacterium TaxID=310071 RepID=A0A6J4HFP6_9ACTN|nr:MAG: Cytochrome c oxidase polypeptide II [uncultured Acidimicrobiales bacterium]
MSTRRGTGVFGTAVALLLLAACSDDSPSILTPRSEAAERVQGLWWLTFWTSVFVCVLVAAFLVQAVRRGRATAAEEGIDKRPVLWGPRFIVIAGLVVSGAVLAGTFAVSLRALNALAGPAGDPALTIEVVGRNWWWEVRYPNGAVTANEIHIPVGRPVEVKLSTADVIHSFWVPQLNVKQDQVPGMDNRISLLADEPGRYRGQCAEFCGLQHAHMLVYVEAQPPAEFDQWLAAQGAPAASPTSSTAGTGRDLFLRSSCAGCHAVRGTSAAGTLGPDLTHLASRETIGAGTLSMQRGPLTGFVRNAQDAKPGAAMPPTELTPEELSAVVDYLMGLE